MIILYYIYTIFFQNFAEFPLYNGFMITLEITPYIYVRVRVCVRVCVRVRHNIII